MKKWSGIYAAWAVGVLSAAALAYWFWVKYYSDSVEQDG